MQIHTLYILARLGIKEHGCSAILADEDIEHSAIDRIHYEKERIGHEYARIISEKVTQDTISFA